MLFLGSKFAPSIQGAVSLGAIPSGLTNKYAVIFWNQGRKLT